MDVKYELHGSSFTGMKRVRINYMLYLVVGALVFGLLILCLNIYQLRSMQTDHMNMHTMSSEVEAVGEKTGPQGQPPVVWVAGKNVYSGYLNHVMVVFDRLGFTRITEPSTEWDVMWSHDYPFTKLKEHISHLKPHQRINKFPGSGYITNKVNLATSGIKHVPKAFKLPKEKDGFLAYAEKYPDLLWIQKNSNHRGISIKPVAELDLDKEGTFVQQYVGDPLLIDGRRFDIGVYTTLTAVDPLRVYINDGDWLVRFCPKLYNPFDPNDRAKYVISDEYMPVWKVPSLSKLYTEMGYTFKESLLAHLRQKGYDTEKLMQGIRDIIQNVYFTREHLLKQSAASYGSSKHFFELVRFDFVLDDQMNIYLMEVNMSPNLSTNHFPPNRRLYESTLFGMLNLVGVARPAFGTDIRRNTGPEREMQVSDRDIYIFSDDCLEEICAESCRVKECRMCITCLTVPMKDELRMAYQEHSNRRQWRRVIPRTFQNPEEARNWRVEQEPMYNNITIRNKWMGDWFRGKCIQDATWCI